MQVATGAMGSLLPKLAALLMEEYNLQKGVKKDVESLAREMKSMHAALRKVGEVPRHQLDPQVKLWADEVRELSYTIEDVVDKFLVRVDARDHHQATDNSHRLKQLIEKMGTLFTKGKARRQIAGAIKDINKEVQDVANRRGRYTVDDIVVAPQATTVDPRIRALYTEVTELVGISGKRDQELIKLLSLGDDDDSKKKLKIVSIVGFGGLGKTTLARAVYNKIKGDFDCKAFVSVGRNPDVKKVFMEILIDLDKKYTNFNLTVLNERQLIDKLREFLQNMRYLIVIDDIWDEKLWNDIKLAFSNRDSRGSRLITTTRIFSVSKACCSSIEDMVYEMKPLCDHDSQMLFYKRIFPPRSRCPIEFEQVSKDILTKCGGVPLAIIIIASLLASDQRIKSQDEWHTLLKSIGRGLTGDGSLEEMQRILSLSYYDLPSHLKACLLYVSVYPEDCMIGRDQLIWKWVAESFVQCAKQGTSLFELGETYFSELINRSMIQPIYNHMGNVSYCRVHDMVLDLICSLSSEDNFVTILNDTADVIPCQSTVRRLSLQNRMKGHQVSSLINALSTSQVRSITIFPPVINMMPPLSSFDVLRVLDLSGVILGESISQVFLKDIGTLIHLRYLCLADTGICKLPPEIGNLQFLQVLDVRGNRDLEELPLNVCKLRRLLHLGVGSKCRLPDGLGNLTSLEVFKSTTASVNIVQALGKLARLRVLHVRLSDRSMELQEAFVACLCSLHNITCLVLGGDFGSMDLLAERWVPPRHLRRFVSYAAIGSFSALPAWVKRDPSRLLNLSDLRIKLKRVQQEEVQILGRLPSLRYLLIDTTNQTHRLLLIGADEFRRIITFALLCGAAAQVVFERGALPMAELVVFSFGVRVAKDDGNGDFDVGLSGSLLSVREVSVTIYRHGVTVGEAKEAEAALERSLRVHPNHPRTAFYMKPNIHSGAHSDDLCDDEEM